MADTGTPASIADSSKPNAGRIYDFLLGGNHNFEVDRMAAQHLLQVAPFGPQMAKLIRWFLGEAVRRLCEDGYSYFMDFASGLPTVDHIHQIAPAGTKVTYSDLDAVTVAYGQEIIKDFPDAQYHLCDALTPEALLKTPEVSRMFAANRKVCFGFNGIAWFLPDDGIAHAMKVLYDWAAPGSRVFYSDGDVPGMTGDLKTVFDLYKNMGQPVFYRDIAAVQKIVRPWKVLAPGFKSLDEWVSVSKSASAEMRSAFGTGIVGAILGKE
jgi:hypothetical protein